MYHRQGTEVAETRSVPYRVLTMSMVIVVLVVVISGVTREDERTKARLLLNFALNYEPHVHKCIR